MYEIIIFMFYFSVNVYRNMSEFSVCRGGVEGLWFYDVIFFFLDNLEVLK